MASALAIVEGEVRELVRRRGIDPLADPETVARLVEEVIGDYRDRAITSALPPMGDASSTSRAVVDAVAGFGPLQPLLDDPAVEEIWINSTRSGPSRYRPANTGVVGAACLWRCTRWPHSGPFENCFP